MRYSVAVLRASRSSPRGRSTDRTTSAVKAAQACLDVGTLKGDDALMLAGTCWAATHGHASLEANEVVGVGDAILDRHPADKLAARLQALILAAHQP